MLLRVNIYPNTCSIDESSKELQAPPQSLLVSLNTSTCATVLTVGRKDATVILAADKSVSRKHMTIELVSSRTIEEIEGKSLPRAPQGSTEVEACEKNDVIAVLTDSSRFGTYLITGDNNQKKTGDDDDATTGDDETDDEGKATSQQQFSQISSVATKLINPTDAKSVKVEEPLVLTNLFEPNGRAVVQCGQNGSTLVIQRVPIRMALSRVNKKTKDLWSSRCHFLGTTLLETMDASMTHLVTVDRVTNAKSLTAWCLQKPLVTFDYLEALWNRTNSNDPLPDPADFEPSQADDGLTFWDEKPSPHLWSHCTMLSFDPKSDDMEALCRAAGATIVELYKADDPMQAADDQAVSTTGCFYMNSTSKTHANILKHLKKLKIPHVTQKSIALCVSEQGPLKDSNDEVIGTPSEVEPQEEKPVEEEPPATEEKPKETVRSPRASREEKALDEEEEELPKVTPRSQRASRQKKALDEEDTELPSRSQRASRQKKALDDEEDMELPSRSQRASRQKKALEEEEDMDLPSRSQRASSQKNALDEEEEEEDMDLPSRSQRASRQKKAENKQVSSEEAQEESQKKESQKSQTAIETQLEQETDDKQAGSSQASKKRSFEEDDDEQEESATKRGRSEEEEDKPAKKKKISLGGWTDVRKGARVEDSKGEVANDKDEDNDIPVADNDEDDNVHDKFKEHFGARQALPTTKDGWLVAAPRDRNAFKATEAELLDALGDVEQLRPIAETDVVKDMVVAAKGQQKRSKSTKSGGAKDYKRFRKNSVIHIGEISRIQMRAVLPKQSDRQSELQEEQAQLEASLREADVLFQDRSGGIASHFKPVRKKTRDV